MRRRVRSRRSLKTMRRGKSKKSLMRRVMSKRIPLRLRRIWERLWESHNRHCLERIRMRRRRRKVNYN